LLGDHAALIVSAWAEGGKERGGENL